MDDLEEYIEKRENLSEDFDISEYLDNKELRE